MRPLRRDHDGTDRRIVRELAHEGGQLFPELGPEGIPTLGVVEPENRNVSALLDRQDARWGDHDSSLGAWPAGHMLQGKDLDKGREAGVPLNHKTDPRPAGTSTMKTAKILCVALGWALLRAPVAAGAVLETLALQNDSSPAGFPYKRFGNPVVGDTPGGVAVYGRTRGDRDASSSSIRPSRRASSPVGVMPHPMGART